MSRKTARGVLELMGAGALAMGLWLVTSVAAAQEPARIMIVGSSITQGLDTYASYRYDLWFRLMDAGFNVDFVGRRNEAIIEPPNLDRYPNYFTTFDRDHEAYHFFDSADLAGIFDAAMLANLPDIIIINTGHRDIADYGPTSLDFAETWISFMIDVARLRNPDVSIVLTQITLVGFGPYDGNNDLVPAMNEVIADLAAAKDTTESRVYLVDTFTGFDPETMMDAASEGVAPNLDGEAFIAGRYFDLLQSVLPESSGNTGIDINAGLNDAWYNPDTPGQGFFFNVFPDLGLMFVAWFTYDTERPPANIDAILGEPGHRWATGLGPYQGDTANIQLELTEGGAFDSGDPPVMQTQDYGSMDIHFQDCQFATVNYNIPAAGVSGSIDVQRIVPDNIPLCESLAGPAAR